MWKNNLLLAIGFVLINVLVEKSLALIGGDTSAMFFVGFHFALVPIFGLIVIARMAIACSRIRPISTLLASMLPIMIPAAVVYLCVTGNTVPLRILNITFNRTHAESNSRSTP